MGRTVVAALISAALGVSVAACIDVEGGETGTYGSPCGTGFDALLRCGLEGGAADPIHGGGGGGGGPDDGGPATCADACEIVVTCQGGTPADLADCNNECTTEGVPQSLLDCIVAMGCNFQACIQQVPN